MEEKLRNAQQAFISKIISHTTHEFKNHLAIINESAGLMGDLLSMEKDGSMAYLERYRKIIDSIMERVAISSELTLKLNHFGHRMDEPVSNFSINEMLEEELKLLGRYAGQKQVNFSTDFSADLASVYNYPSICQYILFVCLEYLFNKFEGPSKLMVKTSADAEMVMVVLSAEGVIKAGSDSFEMSSEECRHGLQKMGAELNGESDDLGKEKLTFSFGSLPSSSGTVQ